MSAQPLPIPWSPADVLEWESRQTERYEYIGGILRMMVGTSIAHNLIVGALRERLRREFRGSGCRILSENVKLLLPDGAFAYPDLMVACGKEPLTDDRVTDAVLIAEVLSRSTADYDRGAKWEAYRALPALTAYLLVAQDRPQLELFRQQPGTSDWRFSVVQAGELEVADGITIAVEEIYADLT